MKKLTDNSPMPFGKHRGTKMANVPASYLLWMLDNTDIGKNVNHPIHQYIQDNIEVLRKKVGNDE